MLLESARERHLRVVNVRALLEKRRLPTLHTAGFSSSIALVAAEEVSRMSNIGPIVFVLDGDTSAHRALERSIRCAGFHSETFTSAQTFLEHPRPRVPSCLILDVELPDIDGLELQRRLADRSHLPLIFVAARGDVPTTVKAMKAGAVEFLIKPLDGNALIHAIRHAIELSRASLRHDAETAGLRESYASLSHREREVMTLVISGMLNREVAERLDISEITVKAHRGRVMRKMHAPSLADLVRMGASLRLVRRPHYAANQQHARAGVSPA